MRHCTIFLFVKFIYFEKAAKFYEISIIYMSYVVPVKSKVEILQNFLAFTEFMNFKVGKKCDTFVLLKNYEKLAR